MKEIQTERLVLRKLRLDDVQTYYDRLGSSEVVTKYMLWHPHRDISESEASIRKSLGRYEEGRCYRWGVALKTDDSIIGVMELLRLDEQTNTCSFAYMLAEEWWGQGYGTEALSAALSFAFTNLKVSAVEADHMAENVASGAVMRKAGMVWQRTEAGKYEKNGVLHDASIYRITAENFSKTAVS
ncbi:MAG: GNAT family N-acetyltransferase [Oscillospiraceae bacterium]|nr:GNAT family N-acetyltransferase [Oscillospiraceae bacterium]